MPVNLLRRVQISSRRRVEFHVRNKSRDTDRDTVAATLNGRSVLPVLRPGLNVSTIQNPKLAA